MDWVGLTGGIASGKSSVTKILRSHGVPVVDADQLAHQALEEQASKLVQLFGEKALNPQGDVDRAFIGSQVFKQPDLRRKLEALIHPEVRRLALSHKEGLSRQGYALAVYDVPLLFEKGLESEFESVLVVYAPRDKMKERLIKRSGLSHEEAEDRLNSQWDIEKKKEKADVVFQNDKGLEFLEEQVLTWLTKKTHNQG